MDKAVVRVEVEKIDGVTRTWFEWTIDQGGVRVNTLVVEVNWDTDPNSPRHRPFLLESIYEAVTDALNEKTTMSVHGLRVVPIRF
jgi:hypothetical protein